jgi:hypothetical protein
MLIWCYMLDVECFSVVCRYLHIADKYSKNIQSDKYDKKHTYLDGYTVKPVLLNTAP